MQLTQKESMLLSDLKSEEKLCIEKYTKYSQQAKDPQLCELFSQIAKVESSHLMTIQELEKGSVTQPSGNAPTITKNYFTPAYSGVENEDKQSDAYLCSDLLMTEKHASDLYNTSVFEFKDDNFRNKLNHIQKEEQEHGKLVYDYMQANGMYS